MKIIITQILAVFILLISGCTVTVDIDPRFTISYPKSLGKDPVDGRLLLLISKNDENEPRFQINDGPGSQVVYGIDVEGMWPNNKITFDAGVFGYPVQSLSDLEPGDYYVEGFLHKYDTYNLSNGNTVKLPASWAAGS